VRSIWRTLALVLCSVVPSTHSQAADLVERFQKLSCAVVRVDFAGGSGTGFFIDGNGRMVTAAHVLYERKWTAVGTNLTLNLVPRQNLHILFQDGRSVPVSVPSPGDKESNTAGADLAILLVGVATPCFIPLDESETTKVGQHLISIGFPASNPTGVLYEGFLSARHTHLPIPLGRVEGRPEMSVIAKYQVLRVQMPITPGVSGAPVIDDSDHAIGVISEIPVVVTDDIQKIISVFGEGRVPGSGITLSGFDTTKILGELAFVVVEFESPGAGFAVPVSYLK
jgi:S1-C subfamily serine protease